MACSRRRRRRLRRARCGAPEGAPRRAGGYLKGGARPEEGGRAHIAMSLRRTDVKWPFFGGASNSPPAPPTPHAPDDWELHSYVHPHRPPAPDLPNTYNNVFLVILDWPPPYSNGPTGILMKPMKDPLSGRDYYTFLTSGGKIAERTLRDYWAPRVVLLRPLGNGMAVAIICGLQPGDAHRGLVCVPYKEAVQDMRNLSVKYGRSITQTFNRIVEPMIRHQAAEYCGH